MSDQQNEKPQNNPKKSASDDAKTDAKSASPNPDGNVPGLGKPAAKKKTSAKSKKKPPPNPTSEIPTASPQANSTNKAANANVTSKPNNQNTAQSPQTQKPSQAPIVTAVLALLIGIAAVAAAGYNWDQQQQFSTAQNERIAQMNNQLRVQQLSLDSLDNVQATIGQIGTVISELNSERGKLSMQVGQLGSDVGQLATQRSRVDQLEQNLAQFTSKLETTLEQIAGRVNEISTSSRSDWQVAEVEYFLRLAVNSLIIEGNTKTAQSLLESADRLVREIDDIGLISLRRAIAEDLLAIRGVRVPDYQGMAFTLNALAKQVSNLRISLQPERADKNLTAAGNSSPAHTVQGEQTLPTDQVLAATDPTFIQKLETKLATLAEQLKGLISIRRTGQRIEPLMPPEQQTYLAQNLHLMLEQAQLALLRKNQALYQQSLEKALDWVQTYYNPEDAASISFVTNITQLKDNEIGLELPDISGSLRTFKQFQKQRLGIAEQIAETPQTKLEVNLQ